MGTSQKLEKLNVGNGLNYFKLAEFNSIVLAYNYCKSPLPTIHYVTWKQREANDFVQGHYFSGENDALNEQQAMRDFCTRSGLLRQCDLLANAQLPEIAELLGRIYEASENVEDTKLLGSLMAQADKIMNEPKEMIVSKNELQNALRQEETQLYDGCYYSPDGFGR